MKVRGALRRQNRSAMRKSKLIKSFHCFVFYHFSQSENSLFLCCAVRLGAARGMEWLRTRVGKKIKPNKETKRHSSTTLHDEITFVKATDLEQRGSQESDVSVNVPWL